MTTVKMKSQTTWNKHKITLDLARWRDHSIVTTKIRQNIQSQSIEISSNCHIKQRDAIWHHQLNYEGMNKHGSINKQVSRDNNTNYFQSVQQISLPTTDEITN